MMRSWVEGIWSFMPNYVDIDPAVLRQLALQHERVAADTREWSKPPADWLASFPATYGAIADPVYKALNNYYSARERAGEALASEHDETARKLRDAALAFERGDQEFASRIRNAADLHDRPTGPPVETDPTPPPLGGPVPGGPVPGGPAGTQPDGTETPQTIAPGSGQDPAAVQPGGPASGAGPSGAPGVTMPNTDHAGTSSTPGAGGGPSGPPTTSVTPSSTVGIPPTTAAPVFGSGEGPMPPTSSSGTAARSDGQPPMPVPMMTPFGAAFAAAKAKEAEPAYVVGDQVNDDLVLARTLLASVLAAVESPVGMAWAVSVMRGPAGAGIFITSNEGRGWMPAKLFLPREVSTPWLWDELLGEDTAGNATPWEGVSDPARVLAEFGLAWGAKANAELSALVSSGPIDPGLRSRFSNVAMDGLVGPAYDVDLRDFTPDTADRLGLTGSVSALEHVAAVDESRLSARCVELAADAHTRVQRSGSAPAQALESRRLRERILSAVQSGETVPRQLWDELRDADDLLAASMLSQRVDVGRVELGQLRVDTEVAGLRDMVFDRRCNELVLLLAEESTRQRLRDAVYAHEQIVEHPQFVETPAAVSTAAPERVGRPVVTPSAVTAPAVESGPPAGAVVAPTTPPPVVLPGIAPEQP
ncbi:type VII secretion target [Nocardia sp. GCM10030253]|uniref:type VII secretion target n=1 Tax=Nocardia sp. GCM10030253 TaxID=3273404 RepID=UPI003624BFDD